MPKPKNRPVLTPKPRLHIFCEGKKTEPNYLNGYIQHKFPGTKLIIVEASKKNTPVELVEEALQAKSAKTVPEDDQFWVVYDREGNTKYTDERHAEARQKAGTVIKIALSNVCFEVWLLLHFQTSAAPYCCYDDLRKRSKLRKHIPNYDKADKRMYSVSEIASARTNAERMNAQTKKGADRAWTQCHQWNPYTDVHKLLDAIDAFGDEHIT
jgi:hypothetical protein